MTEGLSTALIQQMLRGDRNASSGVFRASAERLRRMAGSIVAKHRGRLDCTPSELIQETWIRKFRTVREIKLNDREHFFALCFRAMTQVVIELRRGASAAKRQYVCPVYRSPLDEDTILDLRCNLEKLERRNPRASRILQLRMFHGCSWEEAAAQVSISVWQAREDFDWAKAWLYQELR